MRNDMPTQTVFDIPNYFGRNAGAWADLCDGRVIIFGGMWRGNGPHSKAPTDYFPTAEKRCYRGMAVYTNVAFAVTGEIDSLVERMQDEQIPEPKDFKGAVFHPASEVDDIISRDLH